MNGTIRRCVALASLLTMGACFHYVPAPDVSRQGTRVRAELVEPRAVELREVTANNVTNLSGELVSSGPDRLVLSVFALRTAGGFEYLSEGETVVLPGDAVGRVEERRISAVRTTLAIAILGAAMYAIGSSLGGSSGGGEPGSGTGQVR